MQYALGRARTSSAGNPITFSYTVATGDDLIVLLLNVASATSRAGGAPTWGSSTFTQVNSTQKAAVSPEASAEMWFVANPTPGTQTLTIPNTGALTIFATVVIGRAPVAGYPVTLDASNGGNNTSTNPTPGAVNLTEDRVLVVAITAGGWQAWNPSPQAGTIIANTDDGSTGGGEQYTIADHGSVTLNWTFGTSDDWGAVVGAWRTKPAPDFENKQSVQCASAGVVSVTEPARGF